MPTGKFFYVIRKNDDGTPAVDFYTDQEAAEIAMQIEKRRGTAFKEGGPFGIEMEFDANGKLLTPDLTTEELKKRLERVIAATPAPAEDITAPLGQFAKNAVRQTQSDPLAGITSVEGMNIAFTGKLEMNRVRTNELVKELGATLDGNVSDTTDFLVIGEDTGSMKVDKAREYGVRIVSEKQWLELAMRLMEAKHNPKGPAAAASPAP